MNWFLTFVLLIHWSVLIGASKRKLLFKRAPICVRACVREKEREREREISPMCLLQMGHDCHLPTPLACVLCESVLVASGWLSHWIALSWQITFCLYMVIYIICIYILKGCRVQYGTYAYIVVYGEDNSNHTVTERKEMWGTLTLLWQVWQSRKQFNMCCNLSQASAL